MRGDPTCGITTPKSDEYRTSPIPVWSSHCPCRDNKVDAVSFDSIGTSSFEFLNSHITLCANCGSSSRRSGGRSAHDATTNPVKKNGATRAPAPSPALGCEAAAPE
jgi:hypothetical protein